MKSNALMYENNIQMLVMWFIMEKNTLEKSFGIIIIQNNGEFGNGYNT